MGSSSLDTEPGYIDESLEDAKSVRSHYILDIPEDYSGNTVSKIRKMVDVVSLPVEKYQPQIDGERYVEEGYVYKRGERLTFVYIRSASKM